MHLWFYSSEDPDDNVLIDSMLRRSLVSHLPSIAYIPFSEFESTEYYEQFILRFERFGPARFHRIPSHKPLTIKNKNILLESDFVYLAGGNTFEFLKGLRSNGIIPYLKRFAKRKGTLAGCSAGGIILTPNISTASYPEFDRDDNEIGIRNYSAMNLVNFEFFPHYVAQPRYEKKIRAQSYECDHPIYAVTDGSAIQLDNNSLRFIGEITVFYNGSTFNLHS